MSKKQQPKPFGEIHAHYHDSLQEVLLRAGMMEVMLSSLLEIGTKNGSLSPALIERVKKALDDYHRAWEGATHEPT